VNLNAYSGLDVIMTACNDIISQLKKGKEEREGEAARKEWPEIVGNMNVWDMNEYEE
jgi:hypothetical protein